jgi:hypothetical protein
MDFLVSFRIVCTHERQDAKEEVSVNRETLRTGKMKRNSEHPRRNHLSDFRSVNRVSPMLHVKERCVESQLFDERVRYSIEGAQGKIFVCRETSRLKGQG